MTTNLIIKFLRFIIMGTLLTLYMGTGGQCRVMPTVHSDTMIQIAYLGILTITLIASLTLLMITRRDYKPK